MELKLVTLLGATVVLASCSGGGSGGGTGVDTPTVQQAVSADAGPDQTVQGGSEVTLDAAGTVNIGSVTSIVWRQVSGEGVTIAGPDPARFAAPILSCDSVLTFEARVTGSSGRLNADTVDVLVMASPDAEPQTVTVDAGPDRVVEIGGTEVVLSGSASASCGSIRSTSWTQTAGTPVTLNPYYYCSDDYLECSLSDNTVTFSAPFVDADTVLTFAVTATSDRDSTTTDSVEISIRPSRLVQVDTQYGTMEGLANGGLRSFGGIRYAAPPVGALRFRPPEIPEFVGGVTETKAPAPQCIQLELSATVYDPDRVFGQEDCLFLNIWVPDDAESHPVMVVLHGGTSNGIDGRDLALQTGLIVVAPNRRVGVFGSLGLEELISESPDHTASNYGVLDTVAALRWIRDNISAFGGDPDRVMINGLSAGGGVACSLFAAPSAAGLFSSAALMSGVCGQRFLLDEMPGEISSFPPLTELHAPLIAAAGCRGAADKLACLRDLPVEAVLEAAASLPTTNGNFSRFAPNPVIDGVVVTTNPRLALDKRTAGDFPLIAGSTRDEVRNLTTLPPAMSDDDYRAFLATLGPNVVDELYALYPPTDFGAPRDAAYMFLSDLVFGCPAQVLVEAASHNRRAYLYLITRGLTASGYAVHGTGYPFLFGAFEAWRVEVNQGALDLKAALQSGWASLSGTPAQPPQIMAGTSGDFVWPAYDDVEARFMEFGDPVQIGNSYRGDRCATLGTLIPF